MSKPKILFSIPTKYHVEIAVDEMVGLQALGYECSHFNYAAKAGYDTAFKKFYIIILNAFQLVKHCYKFNPDIVYFNSRLEKIAGIRDFITLVIVNLCYSGKVKFVLKSHGSEIDTLISNNFFLKILVMPYLKKQISGWLFLSSEEITKIANVNFIEANRLFVTKNIVRVNQFEKDPHFRQQLGIPANNIILLYVGRMIREKGIFHMIEAFSKLKEDQHFSFIIVGDGPDYQELKDSIHNIKSSHKVILTGFIPEHDVVNYYSNADILVFPTYCQEGFPMALFNSVAAGMAIITTPTRAATDYLTEPANCLWVEQQNTDAIWRSLNTFYQNPKMILDMKSNNIELGRKFGLEQVSIELAHTLDIIFHNYDDAAVKEN